MSPGRTQKSETLYKGIVEGRTNKSDVYNTFTRGPALKKGLGLEKGWKVKPTKRVSPRTLDGDELNRISSR